MGAAGIRLIVAAALLCLAGCASIQTSARSLEGPAWRVAGINGQATTAAEGYGLSFRRGAIAARFGCNHIAGKYAIRGSTLVTSELAQTLMGCPEPAATFETQGTAVLRQPMRIVWTSDGSLTLSNAAGWIELAQ